MQYQIILLFLLLAIPLHAEEYQMIFKVTGSVAEETPSGPVEKGIPPTHWVLRFAPNYICLAGMESMTVYDFKARRILRFVGDQKISDSNLFAVPARRKTEFERQIESLAILKRANIASKDFDQRIYELENRLSLSSGLPLEARPTRIRDPNGNYTYLLENRFSASYALTETQLPASIEKIFAQFFRYILPIHPNLRTDFLAYRRVPSRFRVRTVQGDRKTYTTLELVEAGPAGDILYTERLRAPVPPLAGGRLATVVRRSLNPKEHDPLPHTSADFALEFTRARDQGFYSDAFLAALECYLQLGDSTDQAIQALMPFSRQDPSLGHLMEAMDFAKDPATANKAVEALNKINRDGLLRKYLYDFSVATALTSLGHFRDAENLYLTTLEKNPLLAGAYVKLGQLYFVSDRMEDAWLCWDTARMLKPDHPLLSVPRLIETGLMKDLPDFF